MTYSTEYPSPLGTITLACDEDAVIGLWFNGQRHYGNILPPETERREHPLLREAKRWLDIYFSGREPDFLPPMRYDSTPFRKCICDIMLTIPYGQTMTYGEIAAQAARRQGMERMSAQAVGGRRGAQPYFPDDPMPSCGGRRRQSYRIRRRHRPKGKAAGVGGRGHETFFHP